MGVAHTVGLSAGKHFITHGVSRMVTQLRFSRIPGLQTESRGRPERCAFLLILLYLSIPSHLKNGLELGEEKSQQEIGPNPDPKSSFPTKATPHRPQHPLLSVQSPNQRIFWRVMVS